MVREKGRVEEQEIRIGRGLGSGKRCRRDMERLIVQLKKISIAIHFTM